MGCGKSKHDVVTGNTTRIRKPTEADESMRRQGSCRCRKTDDLSRGDCGEEKKDGLTKPEEKEPPTLPLATAIVPENVATEEKETTISLPVTTIEPGIVVTEEHVNNTVLPLHEQKEEKIDIETVKEEEKSDDDDDVVVVDTEVQLDKVEEPKLSDVQTPLDVDTEVQLDKVEEPKLSDAQTPLEVEETTTTQNDETVATENDETQVSKDEGKLDVGEENQAVKTKDVESS